MAPKGANAKKESGRAKKEENAANKKAASAAKKEEEEAVKWERGARGKTTKEEKEEKRKAELARKAENARLLAEEEAGLKDKPKPSPKAAQSKKGKEREVSAVSDPAETGSRQPHEAVEAEVVESFAATGIDDALELLEVITSKTDKASLGQQAAGIEKHPERRFKAALEAYTERELPKLKNEQPGLRLQQYKELLFKEFKKSPDNPFNQATVRYDATKEEKMEALKAKQDEIKERLRDVE